MYQQKTVLDKSASVSVVIFFALFVCFIFAYINYEKKEAKKEIERQKKEKKEMEHLRKVTNDPNVQKILQKIGPPKEEKQKKK